METFLQILINVGLAALGLYSYALFACRKHIRNFDWGIFWNENYPFWIWAIQVELVYIVIVSIFPSIELLFAQKIIGLANNIADYEIIPLTEVSERVIKGFVYILGSWILSWLVNKGLNKENKIGKSKP
jgi:hypothetical protein